MVGILGTADELMQEQCHLTRVFQWLTFLQKMQEETTSGIVGPPTAKERMQYNLWVKACMVPLEAGGGKEKNSTNVCIRAAEGASCKRGSRSIIQYRDCLPMPVPASSFQVSGFRPQFGDCTRSTRNVSLKCVSDRHDMEPLIVAWL